MLKKIMDSASSTNDYRPQVNESCSFSPEIPPPAYPKTVSTKLKIVKIASTTGLILVALVGCFILTGIYIQSTASKCECSLENGPTRRTGNAQFEPLIAMPSEESQAKAPAPLQFALNKNLQKVMQKNKKAEVNCIVEKKKATQVVANQPKTLMTPFGNLTSDPAVMHVVGEKMIISCHSGTKRNPLKLKGDRGVRRRRESSELCDCSCAC